MIFEADVFCKFSHQTEHSLEICWKRNLSHTHPYAHTYIHTHIHTHTHSDHYPIPIIFQGSLHSVGASVHHSKNNSQVSQSVGRSQKPKKGVESTRKQPYHHYVCTGCGLQYNALQGKQSVDGCCWQTQRLQSCIKHLQNCIQFTHFTT